MKKLLTILNTGLLFVFLSQIVLAQQLNKNTTVNQTSNFYELQKKFNEKWDKYNVENGFYIEDGKKVKAQGWKQFKRAEYYWEQRVNLKSGEFPKTNAAFEYSKVAKSLKKTDYTESWTNLGTNSSTGGYAGIGRINCVAFHPTDANTFWVGSPSGGIWRTIDGGGNWTILNNNETVLGVSDIAIPSDFNGTTVNTIYIATGDRDGGSMGSLSGGQAADNVSVGVYKSSNGGGTWAATTLIYPKNAGAKIYSLIIHPTNNQILIASTSNGIYKTINGGVNWTQTSTFPVWRLAFKPGDPTVIYGTEIYGGDQWFQSSSNTGDTWAEYQIGSSASSIRSEIAVSPNDVTAVYILVTTGNNVEGIYKSTDSGASFTKVNTNSGTQPGMLGYYTAGTGGFGQGSYDLCIAVDPSNANTVFIGGITTWKSTDGGVTWTANTCWTSGNGAPPYDYNKSGVPTVHADKHALAYQPTTNVLFEGNDGGIYKTTDGGTTWTDLSDGLVISQLYRIGVSQTSATTVLTGLQDNGSKLYNGGIWSDVTGGDGMECIIDFNNASDQYATYVRGQIYRTLDTWASQTTISAKIPAGQPAGKSPTGAWVTPYVIDPNNSMTLFAGYDKVWKTTDRGDNWTSASIVLSGTTKLRSLAIAPSNSLVLYAADQTNMWKTIDGGTTAAWTPITLPTLTNAITYIAVHPTNPDIVWFTVGGYTAGQKVYESTDGGATWNEIGTGLPNLPVMCIVHYKKATDRNVLFVGTDLGVYVKDGANNWAQYNNGLPSVVVSELEIYYAPTGPDKLRAGTFGRGLWETNIDAALPVELTSFEANSVEGSKVSLNWETATEVNNYGFEIERQNSNKINKLSDLKDEDWQSIGFIEGHGNSNSPKLYSFIDRSLSGGSNFVYRLKQIDIDGKYEYSDLVEIKVVPVKFELSQNYPNPFNPATKIKYSVPAKSLISLTIFDVLGREISKLVNEIQETGIYEASFDASKLSSGIYYYSLHSGDFTQTKKMMLVK